MYTIDVKAQKPYQVIIGRRLLNQVGERLRPHAPPCKVALISDDQVYLRYGKTVRQSLSQAGYTVLPYPFSHGEQAKSVERAAAIWAFLSEHTFTRGDLLVALGGGVTGDLTGFAAACYLRGMAYVQIPTTLLAAVDASVGGKTAVNLPAGKNLVGAFWQPDAVLCDCDTFDTLPPEHYKSGIAESLKYGVLCDRALFDTIAYGDMASGIEDVVSRCVAIKAEIVAGDERDVGNRQLLNLGHTPAHGMEALSGYAIPHGHAVAVGMCIMAHAAEKMGVCAQGVADEIAVALAKHGLPTACDYTPDALAAAAMGDKKRVGGRITLVLPEAVGMCRLQSVDVAALADVFRMGMEVSA